MWMTKRSTKAYHISFKKPSSAITWEAAIAQLKDDDDDDVGGWWPFPCCRRVGEGRGQIPLPQSFPSNKLLRTSPKFAHAKDVPQYGQNV
jgi:hypothetical protein